MHTYIYIYQSDIERNFYQFVFLQTYEKNIYNKNNDINIYRKYTKKHISGRKYHSSENFN